MRLFVAQEILVLSICDYWQMIMFRFQALLRLSMLVQYKVKIVIFLNSFYQNKIMIFLAPALVNILYRDNFIDFHYYSP